MLETVQAMIGAWSAERVGVRLSPSSYLYGVDRSQAFAVKPSGIAVEEPDVEAWTTAEPVA
jgi:hypothetical protein